MRILLAACVILFLAAPQVSAGYRVMVDIPLEGFPAASDAGCDPVVGSLPDIDGDGAAELLAVSNDRHTFFILDALTGYVEFTLVNPTSGWAPMVLDVDGNGRPDVLLATASHLVVVDYTGVAEVDGIEGSGVVVRAASPNPFASLTSLSLNLLSSGFLDVKVVDVSGRLVKSLFDQAVTPGEVSIVWDGRLMSGQIAASGLYFFETRFNGKRLQPARVVLAR